MQENITNTESVVNETPIQNVETNVENKEISKEEITETPKVETEKLPKRAIRLEDGTIINNLKITYKNLFDFLLIFAIY